MRHADPQRQRLLFATGVVLVATNMPVGWIGVLAFGALAAAERDPRWIWGGVVVYAFSWVMLGAGVLITGRAGLLHARHLWRRRQRERRPLGASRQDPDTRTAGRPPPA